MTTPVTIRSSLASRPSDRKALGVEHVRGFANRVFGNDLHALRVLSLANGVVGVLNAAAISIHAIGQAYAHAAKITGKSGVKQVDRLLSNGGIGLEGVMGSWVRFVIGEDAKVLIALDWTDYAKDDHTTLCAYVVTRQGGRATPLAWKTVSKSQLKNERTKHELELVERLRGWLPDSARVTLLADRAFGYQELYALLAKIGWDYVLRFRGNIHVEADGETRTGDEWVARSGHARALRGARVTGDRALVGAVVVVKAKKMKEPWCLATSLADASAADIVKLYGRRFTIEETFRDTKDLHFGMGLSATHIHDAERRDRLLLLVAVAHTLLSLLGAASEESGLDRYLKVNTVKRRTHSLYRQGVYWFHAIPTMREEWLLRLMAAFDRIVKNHPFFSHFFEIK